MSVFMLELIYWESFRPRTFLMEPVLTLHSRTIENRLQFPGVFLAAAEWCDGNVKEFYATLWLLLSAGRVVGRVGGQGLLAVVLLSPKQLRRSPSTMSFKDSRNEQSRTPLSLPHCQRRKRVEPELSVQRRILSEVINNSLPSNKSVSLKFCLSHSNKRCQLSGRKWLHKGSGEIKVKIWSFMLRLVSLRHNPPRVLARAFPLAHCYSPVVEQLHCTW